ncbi:ATPase component NikO of energizing module of nickel ECF transporter [hydrothermal vent metagenome]|uniref:ATPase component NikO of energizing module of nickel ECF transporter n=1 Tax=hydrothermal vent metagenome TaxID=652676 RepID=A0A3B0Z9F3_9ZZZZ
MKNTAIVVDNAFFSYPDGHEVLQGISCNIKQGEKVALIGPNGAGKSTFMSLLNGVSLPTSGAIHIAGMPVIKENLTQIRRKVGIVFQDPDDQLFCPTAFDDVAFGPLNLGLPKDEIKHRVKEALATVGLEGFEERSSFHLSFGERKRLALASVLSYQPDILVFDEPSTNMDPLNRRRLIEWLQQSDKTILLCTHDLDIALEVCSRCLMLSEGTFKEDGPAKEILHNRQLLEQHNLELPLALMTHELLTEKLRTGQMDEEHREIIASFLHAHRHSHGAEGHEHIHIHFHGHEHEHLHENVADNHFHSQQGEHHDHSHESDFIQHSHGKHTHHDDDDGHTHDHSHNDDKK